MYKTTRLCSAIVLAFATCAGWAGPAIVQLTFEDLTVPIDGVRNRVLVDQYYNGGQVRATFDYAYNGVKYKANDSVPSDVAGIDLDVVIGGSSVWGFESTANSGTGNFVPRASGDTGALGIQEAGSAALSIQPGASFNNGFSFYYSTLGAAPLTVRAYDKGFGQLGVFTFSGTGSCATTTPFCNWAVGSNQTLSFGSAGVTLLVFEGIAFIDNITLGDASPVTRTPPGNGVPEPATYALMAFGLAAVALTARRRSRRG